MHVLASRICKLGTRTVTSESAVSAAFEAFVKGSPKATDVAAQFGHGGFVGPPVEIVAMWPASLRQLLGAGGRSEPPDFTLPVGGRSLGRVAASCGRLGDVHWHLGAAWRSSGGSRFQSSLTVSLPSSQEEEEYTAPDGRGGLLQLGLILSRPSSMSSRKQKRSLNGQKTLSAALRSVWTKLRGRTRRAWCRRWLWSLKPSKTAQSNAASPRISEGRGADGTSVCTERIVLPRVTDHPVETFDDWLIPKGSHGRRRLLLVKTWCPGCCEVVTAEFLDAHMHWWVDPRERPSLLHDPPQRGPAASGSSCAWD